ncbi:hypothetical protein, partial [Vibrio anguillarum]|uniref:hypothetical protein n=1 Tax=Vibrio anguillarum TaxID=55601 RepID=UPI001BE4665D
DAKKLGTKRALYLPKPHGISLKMSTLLAQAKAMQLGKTSERFLKPYFKKDSNSVKVTSWHAYMNLKPIRTLVLSSPT